MFLKNNLRIILGSTSKIFKNVEAQKKVGYSVKKVYTLKLGKY